MSENLDLVRSLCADWERGDFFASGEWVHPDIEFVLPDGPDPGSWNGKDAMVRAWRDRLGAWDHFQAGVEEYRELDHDRILVFNQARGRGKTSGVELGEIGRGATLFHVRNGKVIRLVAYFDRHRALADLGLKE
jgi:ketosteroid isomerase-like protein